MAEKEPQIDLSNIRSSPITGLYGVGNWEIFRKGVQDSQPTQAVMDTDTADGTSQSEATHIIKRGEAKATRRAMVIRTAKAPIRAMQHTLTTIFDRNKFNR